MDRGKGVVYILREAKGWLCVGRVRGWLGKESCIKGSESVKEREGL